MKKKKGIIIIICIIIWILIGIAVSLKMMLGKDGLIDKLEDVTGSSGKVSEVVQYFSQENDEAVVKYDGLKNEYGVLGKEGKLYTFTEEDVSSDDIQVWGKYLTIYDEDNGEIVKNYVKDLETNKVIAEGNNDKRYMGTTIDGYMLTVEKTDTISGDVYNACISDISGNKIWSGYDMKREDSYKYFGIIKDNYIAFSGNDYDYQQFIINAKTNEKLDFEKNSTFNDVSYENGFAILLQKNSIDYYHMITVDLNNLKKKCESNDSFYKFDVLSNDYLYLESKCVFGTQCEQRIYNNNTCETVKYLVEDEDYDIDDIGYNNNQFYIYTSTGYYYFLDSSYKQVVNPTKLSSDYNKVAFESNYIVFYNGDDKYFMSYEDFSNGKNIKENSTVIKGELSNLDGNYFIVWPNGNGTDLNDIMSGNSSLSNPIKLYDTKTLKEIKIN